MQTNPNELIHEACLNFKWYEAWKSETADRYGIDNEAQDPIVIGNIKQLTLKILQPLRDEFGLIKPQSWYRSEKLEKQLCWRSYERWCRNSGQMINRNSWKKYFARKSHPKGSAIDIEVGGLSNDDLFEYLKSNFKFDQLIYEYGVKGVPHSGWIHISWEENNNRNQAFKIGYKD